MGEAETMLAAMLHGRGSIALSEVAVPTPDVGELLVRVATVGICGTDAHEFADGPQMFPVDRRHPVSDHFGPFIPGHEFSGHVVSIGEGSPGFAVGDLVASGAGISCGRCHWCLRGATNLCVRYVTIGLQVPGALAQYVVVPAAICSDVGPLGLSPDVAALAQPMAIAVHAMRQGRVGSGDLAVIVGAGGIGAFLTFALAESGAETVVLDLDDRRLDGAKRLGAVRVIRSEDGATFERDAMGGDVPIVIYEVSGTESGLRLALEWAEPGTRVVLVGIQGGRREIALRQVTLGEVELIGTNAHRFAVDFPEALRLLGSRTDGWSDVAPMAFPLRDLVEEGLRPIAEARSTRVKTLFDPWAAAARRTR